VDHHVDGRPLRLRTATTTRHFRGALVVCVGVVPPQYVIVFIASTNGVAFPDRTSGPNVGYVKFTRQDGRRDYRTLHIHESSSHATWKGNRAFNVRAHNCKSYLRSLIRTLTISLPTALLTKPTIILNLITTSLSTPSTPLALLLRRFVLPQLLRYQRYRALHQHLLEIIPIAHLFPVTWACVYLSGKYLVSSCKEYKLDCNRKTFA
jgi:hypothetical protein